MASSDSSASISSANKVEGLLGVGLIIALVGFFVLLIFQGVDTLFSDILDSIGNFPGLKQTLGLFGTIASGISSAFKYIFSPSGS
jgi:hypothetical protein